MGDVDVVYGGGLKKENAAMVSSVAELDGGLIARVGILLVYQHKNLHHLLALLSARLLIYSITASYSLGDAVKRKTSYMGLSRSGATL